MKQNRFCTVAAVAALLTVLSTPTSALASDLSDDDSVHSMAPEPTGDSFELYIGDIDEDVAEANGFEVVTNPDGSRESVPVTEQAKQLYEENGISADETKVPANVVDGKITSTSREIGTQARDTKVGECGSSFIDAEKGNQDFVAVLTGFDVILPTIVGGFWAVTANGFISGWSHEWTIGVTDGHWSEQWGGAAIGPGNVFVEAGSIVTLTNGDVCYSYSPKVAFP